MTQLHALSALEQVAAMRRRELSPVELTEHYLERIDRHAAELGAFVTLSDDLARTEAKEAERRIIDEDAAALPPLLGLPLAFKDLHQVAGVRTTFGCKHFEHNVPTVNDWTVGLLRSAGVVTLGTTQAPEFGPTCYTETGVVVRPAVTPYDTSRYASGSSGGSAAAVAAGLEPAGHASDGAGSIRTPAAVCGLVGLKPTRGRVSGAPASAFVSWGTEGPLARSVTDAALLLDVMAQPSPRDIYPWHRSPDEPTFLSAVGRPPDRALRIARFDEPGLDITTDAEVVAVVDETSQLLEQLGHEVLPVDNPVPWDEPLLAAMLVIFAGGILTTISNLVPKEAWPTLQPFTRWCIEHGQTLAVGDYVTAQGAIAAATSKHLAALESFDVVLSPTSSAPAVPVGWFGAEGIENAGDRMLGWSAFTPWANFTGQPSMSLPMGTTRAGLPVGVQITAGRRGDDALLLSLAGQLEQAAPWHDRHPPQWKD